MSANTTNKIACPDGVAFAWGRILHVHEVGDYAIIESEDRCPANVDPEKWEPRTFHVFARLNGEMKRLGRSARTLDSALLTAIAYKHEYRRGGFNDAANSQSVHFFQKMIDMDATED